MKCVGPVTWPASLDDAYALQNAAAARVRLHGNVGEPQIIAAVDTSYGFAGTYLYAAAVVLTFPDLVECERAVARTKVTFPYIPGLFYFREGPAMVEALSKIQTIPDVILVSGHGAAHPRQCGLACHIGLAFDRPAVGCARKRLAGHHRPVAEAKGSSQPILLDGPEVGFAYRSKTGVKPIFISPGHKCDLAFSKDIVQRCLRGFRLPEPLRIAHLAATTYRQRSEASANRSAHRAPDFSSVNPFTEPDRTGYNAT